MKRILCLPIMALTVFSGIHSPGSAAPHKQKNFNTRIKKLRRENSIPAIGVATFTTEKIVSRILTGRKHVSRRNRVDEHSRFHIGSCGKSMTGMLALKLVNLGKISWNDTPLSVYQNIASCIHPDYRKTTFLDFLTHRGDVPPYIFMHQKKNIPVFPGSLKDQRKKTVFWQLQSPPTGKNGSFAYSNMGYVIAASMMEEKTGKSFEELIDRYIWTPLGIGTAGFGPPALIDRAQTWGHCQKPNGKNGTLPVPPDQFTLNPIERPGGDIHMGFDEFAEFARQHLRGLHNKSGPSPPSFYKRIHGIRRYYALGWIVEKMFGHKISIHYGSDGTFFACMTVCHDADFGFVIVTNTATPAAKKTVAEIRDFLLNSLNRSSPR